MPSTSALNLRAIYESLGREAGGRVTTFGEDPKVLDGDATLVATHGHIHEELLSALVVT